jgi:flagellar biosynthesis anti-sigma factor FlgM
MNKINFDKLGNTHIGAAQSARAEKSDSKTVSGTEKNAVSGNSDTVVFSSKGAEVGKLVDQIKGLPDARSERVEALKAQIASGEYFPASSDIADAIMKDEK